MKENITNMTMATSILSLLATWVCYHVARALYNISPLHPLGNIPGPKLAASTLLYEFWYDMCLGGTYTQQIKKMHQKYGRNELVSYSSAHTLNY